jgi:hypothetical protein
MPMAAVSKKVTITGIITLGNFPRKLSTSIRSILAAAMDILIKALFEPPYI